ncbi:MAG: hypothetical protein LBJ36_01020 [Synergistaceae bacterium]|jgi:hypothetical protein|nr:hypothetical protein [Synergistaceae bacterium]
MKVDIWQETKYKTNVTVGGVAILIQSHPISANLIQSQPMAEAVGFLIALS